MTTLVLAGCRAEKEQPQQMSLKESLRAFSQAIADDELDGMTLTIYTKGSVLTPIPETIEGLIDRVKKDHPDEIITIDTNTLKGKKDLLKQLNEESFVLSEEDVRMDITWCFVFGTSNQEKVLEIAVGGWSEDDLKRLTEDGDARGDEYIMQYIYVNGFVAAKNDTVLEILNTLLQQADGEQSA